MVKIQAIRSGDAVDNDGQLLSTFLVNDQIAIDAAALGTMVSAAVQAQITAVFLSHCHMDHVATLPIFLEQRFFFAAGELTVYAHQASITALREHLFNDVLWPDLFRIQAEENLELCRFRSMTVAESVQCNGLSVSAIPMNHTVPTLGFLVEAPEGSVAFVSDTQYDHQWIQSLHDAANLRCLFVECTFPNRLQTLSQDSKHMTPADIHQLVEQWRGPLPRVVITHSKPAFFDEVSEELSGLVGDACEMVSTAITYEFD